MSKFWRWSQSQLLLCSAGSPFFSPDPPSLILVSLSLSLAPSFHSTMFKQFLAQVCVCVMCMYLMPPDVLFAPLHRSRPYHLHRQMNFLCPCGHLAALANIFFFDKNVLNMFFQTNIFNYIERLLRLRKTNSTICPQSVSFQQTQAKCQNGNISYQNYTRNRFGSGFSCLKQGLF